jgi:hypothetical protein
VLKWIRDVVGDQALKFVIENSLQNPSDKTKFEFKDAIEKVNSNYYVSLRKNGYRIPFKRNELLEYLHQRVPLYSKQQFDQALLSLTGKLRTKILFVNNNTDGHSINLFNDHPDHYASQWKAVLSDNTAPDKNAMRILYKIGERLPR